MASIFPQAGPSMLLQVRVRRFGFDRFDLASASICFLLEVKAHPAPEPPQLLLAPPRRTATRRPVVTHKVVLTIQSCGHVQSCSYVVVESYFRGSGSAAPGCVGARLPACMRGPGPRATETQRPGMKDDHSLSVSTSKWQPAIVSAGSLLFCRQFNVDMEVRNHLTRSSSSCV